jgi:hypothetical protein
MARKKSKGTRRARPAAVARKRKSPPIRASKRHRSSKDDVTLQGPAFRAMFDDQWAELFQKRQKAVAVLERHRKELFALPDVTGLHVGLRRRQGLITTPLEYCIRIHVRQKRPVGDPRIRSLLPSHVEKIPVDVWQQSYRSLSAGDPVSTFVDPLIGGVALAKRGTPDNWGTLGCVVFHGTSPMYLTNKHIVGNPGSVVLQPPNGVAPTGKVATIGTVYAANSDKDAELIDAAIIQPSDQRKRRRAILGVKSTLFVSSTLSPSDEHRTQAFKVGAKTGLPIRLGIVKSVNATVDVDGKPMHNQILVESPTGDDLIDGGDSGSVLIVPIEQNGLTINLVVGLVHAEGSDSDGSVDTGQGDYKVIVASHFHEVKSRLGVDVVSH